MRYIKLILLIIVVSVSSAGAQNLAKTATTAAQFLKIGVSPRSIGMGGAFTATFDDVSSIYWNPAGIAQNYSRSAYFNHVEWFADVQLDFAGVTSHIPGLGTVGMFISVLTMDEMLVRTIEQPEGTGEYFSAGGLTAGISYARNLTDNFSIGFNAKYVTEYIWNESASAIAFDIGTMYKIPIMNEFRLAASISNFGTRMQLDGRDIITLKQIGTSTGNLINTDLEMEEYDLPLLFRVGVAADLLKMDKNVLTVAVDAVHPNDHYEYLNTGLEYTWNEMLSVRGGYKSLFERDSEQGLTLGVGLNYRLLSTIKVQIDYAYQDFGRLTEVHYLGMGVKF